MNFLNGFNSAVSGIMTSRAAIDLSTENLVNQQVSGYKGKIAILKSRDNAKFEDEFQNVYVRSSTKEKKIHRKKHLEGLETKATGVEITKIIENETPVNLEYDPTNPEANEDGFVEGSNINTTTETINMIEYKKLFEMSTMAFNLHKSTINTALKIGEK